MTVFPLSSGHDNTVEVAVGAAAELPGLDRAPPALEEVRVEELRVEGLRFDDAAGLDAAVELEDAPEAAILVLKTVEAAPVTVELAPVRSLAPHTPRLVLGVPRPLFR